MTHRALDLSAINFLLVDDDAYMRGIIKSILHAFGARNIREASDGDSAFKLLTAASSDIVITDWVMQPVDGIALTRRLRTGADSPNPLIPIIMLSAYSHQKRVGIARDAGVDEFLTKPVSAKALYLRIEEVVLRRRKFVRCATYFGPDRHRRKDNAYHGPRRRENDPPPADTPHPAQNGAEPVE